MTKLAAAVTGLVGLLAVLVRAAGGGAGTSTHLTYPCAAGPPDWHPFARDSATLPLDGEQVATAGVILDVAATLRLPPQAPIIAVATALQESRLHNLTYRDRDSLGVFQQRPSQGWGTPEQILDPTHAAATFYDQLLHIPNWHRLPLARAPRPSSGPRTPTRTPAGNRSPPGVKPKFPPAGREDGGLPAEMSAERLAV